MTTLDIMLVLMLVAVVLAVATAVHYRSEASSWKDQVDDERTRYDG